MDENNLKIESLESWLSAKPYWEQYVWRLNLDKEFLSDEDLDLCYQYLSEHLGLIPAPQKPRQPISFKHEIAVMPDTNKDSPQIHIIEIKDFEDVNALPKECSLKCGPNLTLVYGDNGSGKSGFGRLLCNACFSRGEREILPNVREASSPSTKAKATFVIDDGTGEQSYIKYSIGENHDALKCFSVFDSKSVLIHLDQTNSVKFTPARIKIFDKVADTISKLERKLDSEKNHKRKDDPFILMFPDEKDSDVAQFCRKITNKTEANDFQTVGDFDPETDENELQKMKLKIDELKKLDIAKKKTQLSTDRLNLKTLKLSLQSINDWFSLDKIEEVNKLVDDILEKKSIIEGLSVKTFHDGLFNKIGSQEWRSLIIAAKDLYDIEKLANDNQDLSNCLLCHQKLSEEAKTLFQKYWEYLESKAESEHAQLVKQQADTINDLKTLQITYPKFLDTDAGINILKDEDPEYLKLLETQYAEVAVNLSGWIEKIKALQHYNNIKSPMINLRQIDNLINSKDTEESYLVDPSADLLKLTNQFKNLEHKKQVAGIKNQALEYIAYLKWLAKADSVNFAGIKMALTKKRTEFFNVGIAMNYKGLFNNELRDLGCDFDLVMITSGEHGNTVKEFRLDFAEDFNPSQILSEGEQNVCSLADFLTETQLDKNNCGIILDDPVSSLDHDRKDAIARRLSFEANNRQVVILTHDLTFMSKLVKYADIYKIPFRAHWMRKVAGVPGFIEEDTSPRLACLKSLKINFNEAINNFDALGAKEQERTLVVALDTLRSACEALIEEVLFAGTVQRYDDHIRVQNLEEVVYNQELALKICDLHGRISEIAFMHNTSDLKRENPLQLKDFTTLRTEFEALEKILKDAQKNARADRAKRKKTKGSVKSGW